MEDVIGACRETRILPAIVIDDAGDAVPLAESLIAGGLRCAEVTLRTAAAVEAILRVVSECPEMVVGAGTVLTPGQAAAARSAGARFIVTPGFNPAVVDYCLEHEIPILPGVCTPTEVEAALERGIRLLKFFPAEAIGGIAYLEAMRAPYPYVEFLPFGGIDMSKLLAYLALPCVPACGGSWMARAAWIRERRFDQIRQEVERSVEVARGHR